MTISYKKVFSDDDLTKKNYRGVYVLFHEKTPKQLYVGYTFCKAGFCGRIRNHVAMLKKGLHSSDILQGIVDKYGVSGIRIKILKICNSLSECAKHEYLFIKDLKPICNKNVRETRINTDKKEDESYSSSIFNYQKRDYKTWNVLIDFMTSGDEYITSLDNLASIKYCLKKHGNNNISISEHNNRITISRL